MAPTERDDHSLGDKDVGVSLDSVSKLLGHSSIKITERHYAARVNAR